MVQWLVTCAARRAGATELFRNTVSILQSWDMCEGDRLQTKPYRTSKRAQPACDRGVLHASSYAVLASPSSKYLEASKSRPSSLG